ncbi:hypothetical protein [Dyella tabacisoli]|uniref:Uncharacterized protein n=1 Tax=Dyella tabacisoli TaxID=2282381 RepID=A0A369UQM6_9GAMM|nr:hypothetical protein [Dyella tabacisoli]RDD82767.1 hypothetical protein DVJ77_04405 [Dyella tabacisoli]
MRFVLLSPRRSRHPLVRALSLLIGLALVGVLLVFGLIVAGVLLVGGAVLFALRQWTQNRNAQRPATAKAHEPEVLEGEFVVLQQTNRTAH